jgi:hypothetical protein
MDVSIIKDEDTLSAWLKDRSREDAFAIALRTAMRVFPLFAKVTAGTWAIGKDITTIPLLRSLITAGVSRKFGLRMSGVSTSANYDHYSLKSYSFSAHSAAAAAAAASVASAVAAAAAAENAAGAANSNKRVVIKDSVLIWQLIGYDVMMLEGGDDPLDQPLWYGDPPDWFIAAELVFHRFWLKKPENWDFWLRWWDGVTAGRPLDWELQKYVALIPREDWQKGPEHIAELIRKIEAGLAQTQDIDPKAPKPDTALYLTQNRLVARMQAQGLAGQIVDVIERYARDTGCNDLPDEFQALRSMPAVLLELGRKVADASTTEEALRAEVQRLNARVLRLEADLREAKARTLTGNFSKSFAEQAGKSLGDWKMWGALIGGVSYLGGVPAMVEAAQSIAESVRGIFGDRLPEPPHADLPTLPDSPGLTDV